jgi:hypothetical protein
MVRPPPTPRPKERGLRHEAEGARLGEDRARQDRDHLGHAVPSTVAAPTKLLPGVATKKKLSSAGVPSSVCGSGAASQSGRATPSIRWAMVSVVSRL